MTGKSEGAFQLRTTMINSTNDTLGNDECSSDSIDRIEVIKPIAPQISQKKRNIRPLQRGKTLSSIDKNNISAPKTDDIPPISPKLASDKHKTIDPAHIAPIPGKAQHMNINAVSPADSDTYDSGVEEELLPMGKSNKPSGTHNRSKPSPLRRWASEGSFAPKDLQGKKQVDDMSNSRFVDGSVTQKSQEKINAIFDAINEVLIAPIEPHAAPTNNAVK